MNSSKYDFYLLLQETCLKNAVQFLTDAELLRNNGSFGHAYSLAVLGFEELSKFWMIHNLFFDIYDENDEVVQIMQSSHVDKHILGWNNFSFIVFQEYFHSSEKKEEILEIYEELNNEIISKKAFERKLRKIILSETESVPLAKKTLEIIDILAKLEADFTIMEKRKQEGFYVEYDLSKKQITYSPENFIYDDILFIDAFSVIVDYAKTYHDSFKSNLKRKSIKEYISNFRKNVQLFKQELKKSEEETELKNNNNS